jgi:hypothetical protein
LRHVPDFSLIGVRRELVKPGDVMLWATQPIGFLGGERGRDRSVLPLDAAAIGRAMPRYGLPRSKWANRS